MRFYSLILKQTVIFNEIKFKMHRNFGDNVHILVTKIHVLVTKIRGHILVTDDGDEICW